MEIFISWLSPPSAPVISGLFSARQVSPPSGRWFEPHQRIKRIWPRSTQPRRFVSNRNIFSLYKYSSALAALAGGGRGASSHQTHEMTVPNEIIGCVIGKGGSKIAEIRWGEMSDFSISTVRPSALVRFLSEIILLSSQSEKAECWFIYHIIFLNCWSRNSKTNIPFPFHCFLLKVSIRFNHLLRLETFIYKALYLYILYLPSAETSRNSPPRII